MGSFDLNGIIPLIVATALPMLPLVLTVHSFDELVLKIVGFLFSQNLQQFKSFG